ncbi:guanine nucleotide-binding protein G(I)/G(S)/G(O) subunit gamma-4 isoform X1 [Nannospalax galili]|nr:guanine nucleotide-binding protein G(I)/G(S)/G(O) subunit gamma-4 isoform X1 [Nannospalax galili]
MQPTKGPCVTCQYKCAPVCPKRLASRRWRWLWLVGSFFLLLRVPEGQVSIRDRRMKEGVFNNSSTSISQARKAVEQLKMEACMDRVKVSQAAADLLAYCEAHMREDPLIIPVPASENPFREKKFFCTIL